MVSLTGYGAPIYERDHYTCVYCGFDGRLFDNWMQLSVEHVRPRSSQGMEAPDNVVTACRSCQSITSRMAFSPDATFDEILQEKRKRVAERRKAFYEWWLKAVAPRYLDKPLLPYRPASAHGSTGSP